MRFRAVSRALRSRSNPRRLVIFVFLVLVGAFAILELRVEDSPEQEETDLDFDDFADYPQEHSRQYIRNDNQQVQEVLLGTATEQYGEADYTIDGQDPSAEQSEQQTDRQIAEAAKERMISWDLEDTLATQPNKPKRFDYREVFSLTTRDRKYAPVFFGGDVAYNPNIIPHPTQHDMWIVVAQHEQSGEDISSTGSEQLTCTAGFLNDVLVCSEEPKVVPVAKSIVGKCEGDLAYFNFRHGPRDARMFYGPYAPYIMYGSQSAHSCLGLWMQDARALLNPFRLERYVLVKLFKQATELQRTEPIHGIEKNFFIFWDSMGTAFTQYDLWPQRAFAKLDADGSVAGEDLAPIARDSDTLCMAKYMPKVQSKQESIHQATNTLSITLCRRADANCKPDDDNTFIMHIFHHKTYYDFHGVYEPYITLMRQRAPYEYYAISTRPFWIHGRTVLNAMTGSLQYKDREDWIPEGHTEMFYITSISWKTHGQRYHGYMDDTLLIAFGIEDSRAGVIDVKASDLVQDLGLC